MIRILHLRRVWLVAAILWTVFIWSNSLQTAAESSQTSQGVLSTIMPFLTWCGLSTDVLHTLVRKAAHMTEFAVLAVLWSSALNQRKIPLLICLFTALADEHIQLCVPGRSCELRDMCIDIAGGIVGILAIGKGKIFLNRRKEQHFVSC